MSVSDPLVKDIKGCVQQFINLINSKTPITDNNFYFVLFVQTLEKIFDKGLIQQQNTKYFNRTVDAYAWMVSVVKAENCTISYAYRSCVDHVKERVDLSTNAGRFRLLIKYCLVKKCIHEPVVALIKSQHAQMLYSPSSIIGDEILSEIFLSVLRQVLQIPFSLDLRNTAFLDTSWYIPEIVEMELVPCKSLGIAVSFASNKAVIVRVEPNGVAAENGNIHSGDILEELNGIHINLSSKGRLNHILKFNKLKPVKIRVVKAYNEELEEIYGPIQNLLRELKIDLESVKKQYIDNGNEIGNKKKVRFYGYPVKYVAKVDVGTLGNVKQVQRALKSLTDIHSQDFQLIRRFDKMVSLEIGEIGLKIRDRETCDHPYMKISSCGNLPYLPKIFGYCAGEENCDVAKSFTCYVFETTNFDDSDTILQSIAPEMEGPLKKLATRASETLGSNSNRRRPLDPKQDYTSSSTGRESLNQFVTF